MNNSKLKMFIVLCLTFISFSKLSAQNTQEISNQINLARHFSRTGRHQEAKVIYEKLCDIQPWNNNLVNLYNTTLLQLKDYSGSIAMLNKRLRQQPGDVNTYGLLGGTYFTMGKQDSAIVLWQKGISVKPDSEISYRTMSRYAVLNRAYEIAIDFLRQGQNISKNPDAYYFEIANLYLGIMDYQNAARQYSYLLLNSPSHIEPVKQNLNRYLSRPMATDETIKSVKEVLEENENATVSTLLAYLYTFQGNYEKAFEIIVDLEKASGNSGALVFNFAETSFGGNDNFAAQLAYKYMLKNHGNSPFIDASKIGYARTTENLINKKLEKENNWKSISIIDTTNSYLYNPVIDIYEQYANDYRNNQYYTEANYNIGKLLKDNFNQAEKAKQYFEKVFTYSPNSNFGYKAKLSLIDIEISEGKIQSGLQYFTKLSVSKTVTEKIRAEAKYKYAQMLFWNNEFEHSAEILSDVITNLKDNSTNDAIGMSVLINTFKKDSSNLSIYASAEYLIARKKYDEAAIEFQKLADNTTIFILPDIAKFRIAEIVIAQNKYLDAAKILNELTENSLSQFSVDKTIFLLAEVYHFGLKDLDNAKLNYEKLLETFPNSIYFATSRDRINLILTNKSDNI